MKVIVDKELCNGFASCVEICPEVFELENGSAFVKMDPVPAKYEEDCRQALASCPMDAISIVEE